MIAYVVWYARRVRRDPAISPVRDIDLEREAVEHADTAPLAWDARHVVTLGLFVAAMVLLVVGVLKWKWYIDQIAVLFLGMGIVLGLAGGLGPSHVARTFVAGAKDKVGVVFIVACARALLVIAQEARVLDTTLYVVSNSLSTLPRGVIAQVMFVIQSVINFFIHSGTAQAALTMPIMAPLGDLVGITRQTTVYPRTLLDVRPALALPRPPLPTLRGGVSAAAAMDGAGEAIT